MPTKQEVRQMYYKIGNWRRVADLLDVNVAVAHRYAMTDYEPKDPNIRRKLGLPFEELIVQTITRDEKGRFI